MPLDQRLRDGFQRSARAIEPDVESGLLDLGARRRRRRMVRAAIGAAVVAAAVIGAISLGPVVDSLQGGDTVPAGPPHTPAPSHGTLIDGRWVTPALSRHEYLAAIPSRYRDEVSRNQHMKASISFELTLRDGRWAAIERRPDRPPVEGQIGTFFVDGDHVAMTDSSGNRYLYRWTISGDALTLVVLRNTAGPTDGVPDRVFQHLIYELQPFTRVS
jgi:hypothetical protein